MPNWTTNRATITGPEPVITEIKQILESDCCGLLNWMVPQPRFENDSDWYNWNVNNWGTKWDITDVYIDDHEPDSITFAFSSAWAPPVDAFRTWAQSDGRVQFGLDYWEPGVGFLGTATYDGEYFDEDTITQGDNPAGYKQVAEDEWGYVEDDEPEPLTEWYTNGVKDKGLEK